MRALAESDIDSVGCLSRADYLAAPAVTEEDIILSQQWLLVHAIPRKTPNRRIRSSDLKEMVDRWLTKVLQRNIAVSNGAILVGMIRFGYEVIAITGTPDAYANISIVRES